jgi:hypothetical protein
MITRTRALIACAPAAATAGLAASIAAPAMAATPARELTVTSATDSGYQAGSPYLRDSSEKDHAMVSRAGSDAAMRLEEGVIRMLRKLSRRARGVAALGQRQVFVSRHPLFQDACLDPFYR